MALNHKASSEIFVFCPWVEQHLLHCHDMPGTSAVIPFSANCSFHFSLAPSTDEPYIVLLLDEQARVTASIQPWRFLPINSLHSFNHCALSVGVETSVYQWDGWYFWITFHKGNLWKYIAFNLRTITMIQSFIFYITYLKLVLKLYTISIPQCFWLLIVLLLINMFLRKLENHTFKDHLVIFIVENGHLAVSWQLQPQLNPL